MTTAATNPTAGASAEPDSPPPTVAVLGTGTMGAPIARNLHRAGFTVSVWNRSAKRALPLGDEGIRVAPTAAEAVAGARFVLTVVKDADAVLDVLAAAAARLAPSTVVVQLSTVGLEGFTRIARYADAHDLVLVDAPVQGTKGPAEKAQLVVLAAAPPELRPAVEPIFAAIGKKTLWVSDGPGDATRLKVVVNSFISALTHGIAEAVRLAEALDVDLQQLHDAISGGPLESAFGTIKLDAIRRNDFAPSFTVDNAIKDTRLVIVAAESSGAWLPVAEASLRRYRAAADAGHGADDMAASYFAEHPDSEAVRRAE